MNKKVEQLKQREESQFYNPLCEKTDVLAIGSGIGCLTTAAMTSRQGVDTLLVEQGSHLGGYFSYFSQDEYIFDIAISYVISCDPKGAVSELLEQLGIQEKVKFEKLKLLDHIVFPNNETLTVPASIEEFIELLKERFPDESIGIDSFFAWLKEYDDGTKNIKQKSFLPPKIIMQNFLKDYRPFLDKFFNNTELKNILSIRIQADPASLFIMGGFVNECLLRGMYYIKEGSFQLPLALGESIVNNGGQVALEKKVTSIIYSPDTDKNHPYIVQFQSGEKVRTKYIVNGISMESLLGMIDLEEGSKLHDACGKLTKTVQKRVIGHSSFNIYLAVKNLDISGFNVGRMYILPDDIDKQNVFEYYIRIESGELLKDAILKVHIPSYYDSTLAPQGESIIRIETDLCNDAFLPFREDYLNGNITKEYIDFEESITKSFIKRVEEKLIPDLQEKIVFIRVISPLGFEKLTMNYKGSGTGWAHTVANYFRSPFSTKLPLDNMFVVGQWGELGSGLRQLVLSGRRAAEQIIAKK